MLGWLGLRAGAFLLALALTHSCTYQLLVVLPRRIIWPPDVMAVYMEVLGPRDGSDPPNPLVIYPTISDSLIMQDVEIVGAALSMERAVWRFRSNNLSHLY